MTDPFSLVGTITALILPWLFGCALLAGLFKTSPRWNTYVIVGHGYLVGLFLTTLIIRAWDAIGLPLHFWSIALCIALLATGVYAGTRNRQDMVQQPVIKQADPTWQRALMWLLVILVLYRYYGLAREIWLRPLYPWDAWMNWAPKAVIWFHLGELASFISPQQWLEKPVDLLTYTTGAQNAWKYPVTVPLIQLWGMLGAGASDQNFSNLPWLLAPLAFGLALYGHLMLLGASALTGCIACYVFLSVPYLSVHSVLAGYADLWLALVFGAATLSLHEWQQSRQWPWGLLSLFFAFTCSQLKLPGLVLGVIVFIVFLLSLIELGTRTRLAIAVAATASVLYLALVGISLDIPAAGLIEVNADRITVPYLGTFQLSYQPVHQALVETIFSMSNWNMFWYIFVGLLMIKLYKKDFLNPPAIELQCLFFLLVFLFFTFYLMHFSAFVLDFSTVNRVLLYAVPTMIFYVFKSIQITISRSR